MTNLSVQRRTVRGPWLTNSAIETPEYSTAESRVMENPACQVLRDYRSLENVERRFRITKDLFMVRSSHVSSISGTDSVAQDVDDRRDRGCSAAVIGPEHAAARWARLPAR